MVQRSVEETALQELEGASAAHLGWLKRVNAALLFRTDLDAALVAVPAAIEAWATCREAAASVAAERRRVVGALRRAHAAMARQAERLAEQHGAARLEPALYEAFMASAEAFARELRAVEAMLRQCQAETDPLTGVHNRLGMMRDLDREWQRSIRTGQPCCIALADLDHFKHINDAHGHLVGDQVLSVAASFFLRRLRPYDRVYRYGGEEFLFLLPNTDLEMAERVLNRMRLLMARLPVPLKDGRSLRVTASIGVADMSSPDGSPAAALDRADRAVYAAKAAGRNRVCVAAEPEPPRHLDDLPDVPAAAFRVHGIPLHR